MQIKKIKIITFVFMIFVAILMSGCFPAPYYRKNYACTTNNTWENNPKPLHIVANMLKVSVGFVLVNEGNFYGTGPYEMRYFFTDELCLYEKIEIDEIEIFQSPDKYFEIQKKLPIVVTLKEEIRNCHTNSGQHQHYKAPVRYAMVSLSKEFDFDYRKKVIVTTKYTIYDDGKPYEYTIKSVFEPKPKRGIFQVIPA